MSALRHPIREVRMSDPRTLLESPTPPTAGTGGVP